jgi:uncharacterized protein (DUF697 family)
VLFFNVEVYGMSWDETYGTSVVHVLHPTAVDMVVTSRRKRFVKLSQQQQARFGYD